MPTDVPGFRVSRKLNKLGNRASDTAELSFEDMRVPVANTIGEIGRGFQQQMAQFQNERMIACYTAVGAMGRAIERTVEYVRQREVFGKPLLDHQYLQFRLAELTAELDLLRHYNYACAEAYLRGDDTSRFATIAKLKAGRLQREIADWCLQDENCGDVRELLAPIDPYYNTGRIAALSRRVFGAWCDMLRFAILEGPASSEGKAKDADRTGR